MTDDRKEKMTDDRKEKMTDDKMKLEYSFFNDRVYKIGCVAKVYGFG